MKPIRRRPKTGWVVIARDDMAKLDPAGLYEAFCELCGRRLRHIVLLAHDDWHDDLLTGRACAERLTSKETA